MFLSYFKYILSNILISQFGEGFQGEISGGNVEGEKAPRDISMDINKIRDSQSYRDKILQEEAENHQCELDEAEERFYMYDYDGDGINDRVISTNHGTPTEVDTDGDGINDSVRQDMEQNIDTDCDGESDLSLKSYTITPLNE